MARETTKETKPAKPIFKLPEGRLINHALFERDVYTPERGAPGKPKYTVELVFDPKQIEGGGTIEDKLLEACLEEWGDTKKTEDDFFEGRIRIPFLNGDEHAKKRAEKGKAGDAYKGKLIIRAATEFNKDGVKGPGGIQVWSPEVEPIALELGNTGEIYQGCYGVAAVTIATGKDPDKGSMEGTRYVKFYLSAFQKTRDGEKLSTGRDTSKLFEKVGRAEGGEGRRSRRG